MAMDIGTLVGYLELDSSKFEESAQGVGKKMPGWMAAAGATAAVAAAAAFTAAFVNAVNIDAGNDKIAAQLGLTEEESARAGDAAAGAYVNAFGESMEEVQGITAGVISSIAGMKDANVADLQSIVEKVSTLSSGFEIEADRISQVVGQMLSTGLASSAEEGLDLLTAALQKVPAAVREDILDATDEYGPFFASIGMSGEDAMNALVASSEKGMYGIDKTGDAIKELSIRATDMSTTSVAAYEAAGLNAEEMAGKILAGGDTAKEGFTQIVDGLLGIEDPTARANAAIGLFGTPLEDLGVNEIPTFLAGLQDTGDALGDVEGAAGAMADTMGGNVATQWTALTRQFEGIMTTIAGGLLPVLEPLLDWIIENPVVIQILVAALAVLAAGFIGVTIATWAMNTALLANPITWIVLAIVALIAALVLLVMNWDTVVAWISEVWAGFIGWFTGVMDGFIAWWNGMWEGFASWVTQVWEGFIGFITGVWSGFVSWLQSVGDGIASWWNGLWAGIGAWIQSVWEGIVSWVTGVVSGFVSFIISAFNAYVSFWSDLWNGIRTTIENVWNGIISWFQGIPDQIMNVFSGAATWLYNIGKDVMQGLWNGLKAIWTNVSNWFEDTFGGIIDTVAGIFGIASPSRVFREFGINIGQGFIQGLDAMAPRVEMAVEDMAHVPDTAAQFIAAYPPSEGASEFHYHAAENQSLDAEEALFDALGSPRSPFGGK